MYWESVYATHDGYDKGNIDYVYGGYDKVDKDYEDYEDYKDYEDYDYYDDYDGDYDHYDGDYDILNLPQLLMQNSDSLLLSSLISCSFFSTF